MEASLQKLVVPPCGGIVYCTPEAVTSPLPANQQPLGTCKDFTVASRGAGQKWSPLAATLSPYSQLLGAAFLLEGFWGGEVSVAWETLLPFSTALQGLTVGMCLSRRDPHLVWALLFTRDE